ncbi:MAG TPA: hypothetical protein VNL34_04045 [Candidatus Nitrosotenuis sp.]|nr:hypothetical protein [Candidatus Nitrosotenuis sp.]
MKKQLVIVCLLVVASGLHLADAQTVQVNTSKKTYNYGDYLQITIIVSEISDNTATMYIIDSEGTKSSSIQVRIQNLTTTITSPNPFDSLIFKEGKYKIEIQYGESTSFTEFDLVDAGNIVLPFGSNVIIPQWVDGVISDYGLLKFLADNDVLEIQSGKSLKEDAKIPSWFKINAQWWSERKISDGEFVNALNYLLNHKVISL